MSRCRDTFDRLRCGIPDALLESCIGLRVIQDVPHAILHTVAALRNDDRIFPAAQVVLLCDQLSCRMKIKVMPSRLSRSTMRNSVLHSSSVREEVGSSIIISFE